MAKKKTVKKPAKPAPPRARGVRQEVEKSFLEAQLQISGARAQQRRLRERGPGSPELTAGDVDAAWERAGDVGEEAPGGTVSTPDQDIVEEVGKAVGQTYEDNQPLDDPEKLERRGGRRWEMDPASSEDYGERQKEKSRKRKP